MPKIFDISEESEELEKRLIKLFQSGNINFLIGSGASAPAINPAASIEQEIKDLFDKGNDEQANDKLYKFLKDIQIPNNKLLENKKIEDKEIGETLEYYRDFLGLIEIILIERKSTILPKKANLFTTNYDLFIEKASEDFHTLILNDGFSRTPNLQGKFIFDPRTFSNTLSNSGNLYNYTVEIPSINLIKIHGSLSWEMSKDDIKFSAQLMQIPESESKKEINEFIQSFALVLPQKDKFRETLLNRFYYDLLRIYANELDKENTLLVSFGFSFNDEHIQAITKRALKNSTLQLVIFPYSDEDVNNFKETFEGHNNVYILSSKQKMEMNFKEFNGILTKILPKIEYENAG